MKLSHRPYLLLIFDGFGYRPERDGNAIAQAHMPVWNALWQRYPHILLSGSGADVGLPDGQMGNSEVGHLNIGAGRMVPQELGRINMAIESGSFFENAALCNAVDTAVKHSRAVHILGLLSDGGVHSSDAHIHAMVKLAAQRGAEKIYIHAFLDGRDTPPKSAKAYIQSLEKVCHKIGRGKIASLCGRYYAMDRDKRWERVQQAYDLLTLGKTEFHASTAEQALQQAYDRGETDEFVKATMIAADNKRPITINEGDAVIFMNYRADRARQLTHAFVDASFSGFTRSKTSKLGDFVSLTEYAKNLLPHVAYPPQTIKNSLGEYISQLGLKQLRIAETEKYAHVTFFFNGGIEKPFEGEDRKLILSPKVATYDLKPEMSAPELTDQLVAAIESQKYDLIICNYANADMVGHTGILSAAIKAVEALDNSLAKIIPALQKVGGEALITADHGNVEDMFNHETHQPHTAHTTEPVPFLYVGDRATFTQSEGTLCNVAPSLLTLMGLVQPVEMTAKSLLKLK
jgi:2,3-bisphosphoglycerate-independent phosphoglycerate mutase